MNTQEAPADRLPGGHGVAEGDSAPVRGRYYLSAAAARVALAALRAGRPAARLSADLTLTTSSFPIEGGALLLDEANRVSAQQLQHIVKKEGKVFLQEGGTLRPLEDRTDGYVKLVPTGGAPTVEIDGIKMHRSKDIDPFADARAKVRAVVHRGQRVLDTCGGLGYTAIWAVRRGARQVLTIEPNRSIVALRDLNPWSADFVDPRIEAVAASAEEYMKGLPPESVDALIHDPPRFSLAPELYGVAFYHELYRVLRFGGQLYHYTGAPYRVRRGDRFVAATVKRLRAAGFSGVTPNPRLQGVVAVRR